jgi:hypothetical protein
MTLDIIFTVKNEHLQRLSPDEAVWFFADLLRAETRRLVLPVTSVNISSRTNEPDGNPKMSSHQAGPAVATVSSIFRTCRFACRQT